MTEKLNALSVLLQAVEGAHCLNPKVAKQSKDVIFSGFACDSRLIESGQVFFALNGANHDGQGFIDEAIKKGAVAIVTEHDERHDQKALSQTFASYSVPVFSVPHLRQHLGFIGAHFWGIPSESMHVIGVTGTNGKSTTAHLIATTLNHMGVNAAMIGTLGVFMKNQSTEATINTTPEPIALQRLLAECVQNDVPWLAIEASSHALEQGRLNGTQIETAVFTNLTHEHLDYHGSMAAYAKAKKRLFEWPSLKYAVINQQDEYGRQFLNDLPKGVHAIGYATGWPEANSPYPMVFSHTEDLTLEGIQASICTPWGEGTLKSPLIGHFNLANLLATIAVLGVNGWSLETVLQTLRQVDGVAGRLEPLALPNGGKAFVDYAHTPDALAKVMASLKPMISGRLVLVFGCGGNRDRQKRAQMGQVAEQYADQIILTNDNPRTESPEEIIADIKTGMTSNAINVVLSRVDAIHQALSIAESGDVVLIAGKGHEDYQEIMGRRHPMSDIHTIKTWVKEASKCELL